MKLCVKCGENKQDTDFSLQSGIRRDGTKDRNPRLCSWCKKCSCEAAKESYQKRMEKNPELVRAKEREWQRKNKEKRIPIIRAKTKAFKEKCVEYLGGECKLCEYNKCIAALDFHHRDPKTKKFEVSRSGVVFSERVREELDKCDLLCSNCHKELHYEQGERLTEVA